MASRRPRWGFAVLGALAVMLAAWAIFGSKKKVKADRSPAVPVATARAAVQDMPLSITELGAAQAWSSVLIKSQVNGRLLTVPVQEGSFVRKGQVLAQIEPSQYESAVLQAEGALKRDQALLDEARIDLERYRILLSQDSASRQQFDTQSALVKQDEGLVLIDQGLVLLHQGGLGIELLPGG